MKTKAKKPNKQKIDNRATKADRVPSLANSPINNPNNIVQIDSDPLDIQLINAAGNLQRPVVYGLFDQATRLCIATIVTQPRNLRISGIVKQCFAWVQREQVGPSSQRVEAGVWNEEKE
jgi:hypothetical protein